ncbi:hypothetical protein FG05_07759 [Fusarium graminearum]|nr:hypothetical protein FG05_07759 [Fusarium graminearum]
MANYASTSTAYPSSVYSLLARINHLSETVRRMPYDFPILDRAQRRLGLVNLTFNLPSREFMRLLHEDLSKLSFEMDIVLSHLSDEENPGLRVYLVHKLESVQSAFNKIYTVVLNLALLRVDILERYQDISQEDWYSPSTIRVWDKICLTVILIEILVIFSLVINA